MLYLSSTANLVILTIFSIPFYISIAGWSFKYYAIKSNSSPTIIEDFIANLRFPVSLFFQGKPSIVTRLNGKEFINNDLKQARFQRILITIVFSLFHIPIFIGIFNAKNSSDALCNVIFFVISMLLIVIAMRFGHRLLSNANSG